MHGEGRRGTLRPAMLLLCSLSIELNGMTDLFRMGPISVEAIGITQFGRLYNTEQEIDLAFEVNKT